MPMQRDNQAFEHSIVTMTNREFTSLSHFIYEQCGIKMPEAKKTMLEGRLQKRLRSLGMKNFSDYTEYLFSPQGNEQEVVQMIDLVTTNKTDFFREPDHFDYLRDRVLPEWCDKHPNRRLQVWSAGCSTGQEPYTLAMVMHDFACRQSGFDFQILATDISTRVLEQAKKAIYTEAVLEPVPPVMKSKYLMRSKDHQSGLARIVPELRAKLKLRRLNFLDDDFGLREPMDVIFCRNVIIYFDRPTQARLLQKFYGHLRPGGHIFMGHSETLSGLDVPLVSVAPTVYRKVK
jgi:chemotaxis protein methyltransferase CheR